MKVLVTGANGFVGRALCRRLAEKGWPVTGATRQPADLGPGVCRVAMPALGPDSDWQGRLEGIDAVVHLAARVHVMKETTDDPALEFDRVNRDGTLALARAARDAGVGHLLFVSTVKVMGEATAAGHPFRDTDPPRPEDDYGRSKLAAEDGLAALCQKGLARATVLRPPLVYGPGVKANFRSLVRLAASGLPLPLAAIANRRSLIHVDNLADAIATALAAEGRDCERFLVSDGEDLSVADLVRRLAAAQGRPARLFPVPPALLRLAGRMAGKTAAVERLVGSLAVDPSGFCRRFGWTPPVSLDQGLAGTVRNCRDKISG